MRGKGLFCPLAWMKRIWKVVWHFCLLLHYSLYLNQNLFPSPHFAKIFPRSSLSLGDTHWTTPPPATSAHAHPRTVNNIRKCPDRASSICLWTNRVTSSIYCLNFNRKGSRRNRIYVNMGPTFHCGHGNVVISCIRSFQRHQKRRALQFSPKNDDTHVRPSSGAIKMIEVLFSVFVFALTVLVERLSSTAKGRTMSLQNWFRRRTLYTYGALWGGLRTCSYSPWCRSTVAYWCAWLAFWETVQSSSCEMLMHLFGFWIIDRI